MHTMGNQSGDRVISLTNGSMPCKSVFLLSPQCVYLSNYWSKWDESSVKPKLVYPFIYNNHNLR